MDALNFTARRSVFVSVLLSWLWFNPALAADQLNTQQEKGKTAPLNINTADAKTLAKGLKGISIKEAEAIVAFRDQLGPFESIDQLVQVEGITWNHLKENGLEKRPPKGHALRATPEYKEAHPVSESQKTDITL